MSIGERITKCRTELGISQMALAKALSVSRQAVSKWENDQTAPDTVKLIQLADALSTDVEYLATGKHPEPQIVTVEKVVETVIEKPVYIEKRVPVEKIVERIVEKPVIRKVYRTRYLRSRAEFLIVGIAGFLLGLLLGKFI